ncbi:MAG: hypothetical protein NC834_06855 [Candidatus Omnitrophica bacterium]|nr:hypothetical protein [Candidatus Omnitrophota bacterium]
MRVKILGWTISLLLFLSLSTEAIFFSEEFNFSSPLSPSLPSSEISLPAQEEGSLHLPFPQASQSSQTEELTLPKPINLFPSAEINYPEVLAEPVFLFKALSAEEKNIPFLNHSGMELSPPTDFSERIFPELNKNNLWEKFLSGEKKDLLTYLGQWLKEKNLSKLEKTELIKLFLVLSGYPLEPEVISSKLNVLPEEIPLSALPQEEFSNIKEKIQEFFQKNGELILEKLADFGVAGTIFYAREIFPHLSFSEQKETVKKIVEMERKGNFLEKKLTALTSLQILELVNKKDLEKLMNVLVNNLDAYEGNFLFFDLTKAKEVWDNLLKEGLKGLAKAWENQGVIFAVVSTSAGIFLLSSMAAFPFVGFIPKEVMSFEEFLRLVTKVWLETQKPGEFPLSSGFPWEGNILSGYYALVFLFWLVRKRIYGIFAKRKIDKEAMAKILIKAKPVNRRTHLLSPQARIRRDELPEDIEIRLRRIKYWANYLANLKKT